jgi:hypothetical protein
VTATPADDAPSSSHSPVQPSRRCTRCHGTSPASMFPPSRRMASGLSSWCRTCRNAGNWEWRADNREAINAATRTRAAMAEPVP